MILLGISVQGPDCSSQPQQYRLRTGQDQRCQGTRWAGDSPADFSVSFLVASTSQFSCVTSRKHEELRGIRSFLNPQAAPLSSLTSSSSLQSPVSRVSILLLLIVLYGSSSTTTSMIAILVFMLYRVGSYSTTAVQ